MFSLMRKEPSFDFTTILTKTVNRRNIIRQSANIRKLLKTHKLWNSLVTYYEVFSEVHGRKVHQDVLNVKGKLRIQ